MAKNRPQPSEQPPTLDLATTDELLDELHKRYDACVFAGHHQTTGHPCSVKFAMHGCGATMLGLAHMLLMGVTKQAMDASLFHQEDEEGYDEPA